MQSLQRYFIFYIISIIVQYLNYVITQDLFDKPYLTAKNLELDYLQLGVLYQKVILNQTLSIFDNNSSQILKNILQDFKEQQNNNINVNNDSVQKNIDQIEQSKEDIQSNDFNHTSIFNKQIDNKTDNGEIYYLLKNKYIKNDQIVLILQLNKQKEFYLNVYNNFIKCVKITISCRDESFLEFKAEDINDPLRYQYKNIHFEQNDKNFQIQDSLFQIETSDYNQPLILKIYRKSTKVLLFSLDERFIMSDKYIHLKYQASSQYMFGYGERNYKFQLNFNESAYTIWNRDSPQDIETATSTGGHNTYGSHPIYLLKDTDSSNQSNNFGHKSQDTDFHLVYLQNMNAMDIYLSRKREIEYRITGGILDFKIIACNHPKNCIQRYQKLLGKQALMPLWAYGFHQSRWGYKDFHEIRQVIQEYNFIEFPVESIFLDIDYMINYNTFTINTTAFPLSDQDIMNEYPIQKKIVPILDVGIGLENRTLQVRNQAIITDIGVKNIDQSLYVGRVWPGFTLFPDFEKPQTQIFWQNYTINFMKENNISAFWLDMNEYANFCHGICEELYVSYREGYNLDAELYYEGLPYIPGGRSLENMSLSIISIHDLSGNLEFNVHNINGYQHSQSTFRAVKYGLQNPLPFLISRSTIPGSGKYVSHWAGDNNSSYTFMAYSVASLFNFHIFGIDFTGSDICGFMSNTTEQLCNRWGQLGSLYPFSRNHNHEKLNSQEFFKFDEYGGALYSIRQKYSLLKYYYSLTLNNTYKVQPAFMNYPNENALYDSSIIETHIMIGEYLLSVPVLKENATTYQIYFPPGNWYNISNGHVYNNKAESIIQFNNYYSQAIDIFLREGHIIFQQFEKILSSDELSNKYNLKCGFNTKQQLRCNGVIVGVNNFTERNVHLKCTQPFNCLYNLNLDYIEHERKINLNFEFLDDIKYNLPESIFIQSITIYSDIFNKYDFNKHSQYQKVIKNNYLYKKRLSIQKIDNNGIIIYVQLRILYDSQFQIFI